MSVIAIHHVQLAMPPGSEAEAQAVGFYEGVLGIGRVAKPPHLAARGGCWFVAGPVAVHLGVDDQFRPARKAHPALLVDRMDELVATLRAAGHDVREEAGLDGFAQRYVDDPFGNRIELLESTSD